MTDDNGRAPITFGGIPVHQRLSASMPQLTKAVIDLLVTRIPVYASLPAEQLGGDVRAIIEQGIRVFVTVLREDAMPEPDQLSELRESAARRAEEGLPIGAVISAYHLGAQACMDALAVSAGPEDVRQVFAVHRLVLDYLRLITAAVSSGYLDEHESILGEEQAARQRLLSALLDGAPVDEMAGWAGVRLPACYLVVSLAVGAHADEHRAGVDPAVAARRKRRRLQRELDRHVGEPVLSTLSASGGLALIPYAVTRAQFAARDRAWLEALFRDLRRASGAEIVAAVVPADPPDVPAASRLALELRDVAVLVGRPPGVYLLADLLLDYQLSRPSPARDSLAALLGPVRTRPELLDTLRAYLATSLSRGQTAGRLRIHPNTVDYRIRKVGTITGLNPANPDDLLTLRAALAAMDAGHSAGR